MVVFVLLEVMVGMIDASITRRSRNAPEAQSFICYRDGTDAIFAVPTGWKILGADPREEHSDAGVVDGWQQIRKDFAYWRAAVKGAQTASSPEERAWFEADWRLREKLTLRDIAIWSHYVADASQPMHVSVHFNGWGDFPNPQGFTNSKRLHAHFEGEFVKNNLKREAVAAWSRPTRMSRCPTPAT